MHIETFGNCLSTDEISAFVRRIDELLLSHDVTKDDISYLATECSSFLLHAAESAGMLKQVKVLSTNNNIQKPSMIKRLWFNEQCRTLRSQYKT